MKNNIHKKEKKKEITGNVKEVMERRKKVDHRKKTKQRTLRRRKPRHLYRIYQIILAKFLKKVGLI